MKILILTAGSSEIKKIKEFGVLTSCLSECLYLFEIGDIENYEKFFESKLVTRRIEIIFDNDWPVEDTYNGGEIGYCYHSSYPASRTIWYKRTEEGKLKAVWKAENPNEYNGELGEISKLMFGANHCLRRINIKLPVRIVS